MTLATTLLVNKSSVADYRIGEADLPTLTESQVLFSIDRFAITANNVTYAVFGEMMKYWQFFPSNETEWGVVPVWGFGTVAESTTDGVDVGARFYGYFPMASHLIITAARVTRETLFDGVAHRRELSPVYNQYVRTSTDPSYVADLEAEQMLFRPLFTTSFLIDDFLEDNQMFGAQTIVLSSASSKTTYGTAFCLHRRGGAKVVGLTSERNRTFTEQLGCYDQVLTYDEVGDLDLEPTSYIDLSGSSEVRRAIHEHLGDHLTYDCSVGATHFAEIDLGRTSMPGPRPASFFAPSQITKRIAEWGATGYHERLGAAWSAFLSTVGSADRPWMRVEYVEGPEAIGACFAGHAAGAMAPEVGHIASMGHATAVA